MLKKILPLLLGLLIALCGLAACEETPNPGPGPDPQPSDPTFEVLSTLEFYNWKTRRISSSPTRGREASIRSPSARRR